MVKTHNKNRSTHSSTNPLAVGALIVGSAFAVTFLFSSGLGSARPRTESWPDLVPSMVPGIPNPVSGVGASPTGLSQQAQQVTSKSLGVADRVLDTMDSATRAADRVVDFGNDTLDHLLPSKNSPPLPPDPLPATNTGSATSSPAPK